MHLPRQSDQSCRRELEENGKVIRRDESFRDARFCGLSLRHIALDRVTQASACGVPLEQFSTYRSLCYRLREIYAAFDAARAAGAALVPDAATASFQRTE